MLSQLRIKKFKLSNLLGNWVCSLIKIVLRKFYIEYFSTFGGNFAPIVEKCLVGCFVAYIGLLLVAWCKLKNDQTGRCYNFVL